MMLERETPAPARAGVKAGTQKRGGNVVSPYISHFTTTPQIVQIRSLALPLWLPPELEAIPQWVGWRREESTDKEGKPKVDKIPVNVHTGGNAATSAPSTWATLDEALDYYHAHPDLVSGIGLVVRNTQILAVDLDHAIDEAGELKPWALDIVRQLDTYTELSPSGRGLRLFAIGEKPGPRQMCHKKGIELYDTTSVKFVTFTGHHLPGTPLVVNTRPAEIAALYRATFPDKPQPERRNEPQPVSLDDTALLQKAFAAKNGADFLALWRGNASSHPSPSEADLALCCNLAFWTGGDAKRIDRMFRQSGLLRDKWDERHAGDGSTYGEMTVDKALELTADHYTPQQAKPAQPAEPPAALAAWQPTTEDYGQCPLCSSWHPMLTHDRRAMVGHHYCHKAKCPVWRKKRAHDALETAGVHLWPVVYMGQEDDGEDWEKLRDSFGATDGWLGAPQEDDIVPFVSSVPRPGTTPIAHDLAIEIMAEAIQGIPKGKRVRKPKQGKLKRAAAGLEKRTVRKPKPEPLFNLASLNNTGVDRLLGVLTRLGAEVQRYRGWYISSVLSDAQMEKLRSECDTIASDLNLKRLVGNSCIVEPQRDYASISPGPPLPEQPGYALMPDNQRRLARIMALEDTETAFLERTVR